MYAQGGFYPVTTVSTPPLCTLIPASEGFQNSWHQFNYQTSPRPFISYQLRTRDMVEQSTKSVKKRFDEQPLDLTLSREESFMDTTLASSQAENIIKNTVQSILPRHSLPIKKRYRDYCIEEESKENISVEGKSVV
ncbi:uncharacterized protein LOC111614150 [Centruroides sculpturatus]|uniref:uncharacterized protein LOC111614150 n=1 Tax=Centruroides sculpturatus TaxID=218467 RepID=UPI000C6D50B5|nr:uncharacterized protein LOC111614150 [Centruroides sculpturatus]